ncbi:MAG: poly(R)-hydroxyalkanoic acid synthase subunit PhaE, partial [Gammaproteobacteria bacterium]
MPEITPKTDQPGNPVWEAMENWWKTVSPYLPQGNMEFVSKILEQCRIYYNLGDQFVIFLNEINKLDKKKSGWESLLTQQFEDMKNIFGRTGKEANKSVDKLFGAWQLMPLDTLQRTFSLSSIMPGDFLGDLKSDPLQKVTDKFLSIPGVGYTRESQEQIQDGIRLWYEY